MKQSILLFTAIATLLLSASILKAQTNEYKAADSNIVWVGRVTADDGGNVSGDWSGIYARLRFTGDGLSVKVSDSKKNYYNLWLDKETWREPDKIVTVTGKDTTIVLLSKEEISAICKSPDYAAKAYRGRARPYNLPQFFSKRYSPAC